MPLPAGATTYSFTDTVGAIVSAIAGPYILGGGNQGAGQFVVDPTTTRSEQETAADGAVMISYIPGDASGFSIECQQTSAIYKWLLRTYNLHKTAADAKDVSNWATTVIQLRNILDGSQHLLTGVSFTKMPTKTYASRGGMVTWQLLAANAVNL